MAATQNCQFETQSIDGLAATVVCRICGLRASAPAENARAGVVYAVCRQRIAVSDEHHSPPPIGRGPGTELSKLLKRFGIEPTPTCSCRAKSAQMDAWGCDEASKPERIDEVVAVMRAEAAARGLPFLDAAGRLLVRRAIRNARRNA